MNAEPPAAMLVDARGMRCPWPALRLARAVRDGGGGDIVLLADDPNAVTEIGALAETHGWTMAHADGRFEIRTAGLSTCPLPKPR